MAVGRGPRARAGRARADPQRAARVAPGDRAAAGADGVEVEHRQRDRTAADRPAAGLAGAAVLDHADVARRAAHVEAERVGLVRGERGPGRAGGAAGRARQHGQRGVRAGLVERGQAARGLHDVGRRQVRVGGALGQRAQVGGQQGGEGGVDLGRRRALVLAERADDLVAERDVHAGELLGQRRAERPLVLRVAVGVEQADGHRLGIQPRDLARERRGVRERRRGPVGRHPLRRADAPVRGHERRRVRRAQPVEVGTRLAAELDDVLEAAGGDEHRARAVALEQRVGRDGGAVRERLDLPGVRAGLLQRRLDGGEHALRLVLRRRRRLRRDQPAPGGDDGVREGAADVDAQEHGRGIYAAARISSVSTRCWCEGQ